MSDDVLNVQQAAALLKLGRSAMYRAIARNQVPHRRIGRHIRFSRAGLIAWLAGAHGTHLTAPPVAR